MGTGIEMIFAVLPSNLTTGCMVATPEEVYDYLIKIKLPSSVANEIKEWCTTQTDNAEMEFEFPGGYISVITFKV